MQTEPNIVNYNERDPCLYFSLICALNSNQILDNGLTLYVYG